MGISSRHKVCFHPWCRTVVAQDHTQTHFQFKVFKSGSPFSSDEGQQEGTEMLAASAKISEEKHTENRLQLHHGCFTNQHYFKITLFFPFHFVAAKGSDTGLCLYLWSPNNSFRSYHKKLWKWISWSECSSCGTRDEAKASLTFLWQGTYIKKL